MKKRSGRGSRGNGGKTPLVPPSMANHAWLVVDSPIKQQLLFQWGFVHVVCTYKGLQKPVAVYGPSKEEVLWEPVHPDTLNEVSRFFAEADRQSTSKSANIYVLLDNETVNTLDSCWWVWHLHRMFLIQPHWVAVPNWQSFVVTHSIVDKCHHLSLTTFREDVMFMSLYQSFAIRQIMRNILSRAISSSSTLMDASQVGCVDEAMVICLQSLTLLPPSPPTHVDQQRLVTCTVYGRELIMYPATATAAIAADSSSSPSPSFTTVQRIILPKTRAPPMFFHLTSLCKYMWYFYNWHDVDFTMMCVCYLHEMGFISYGGTDDQWLSCPPESSFQERVRNNLPIQTVSELQMTFGPWIVALNCTRIALEAYVSPPKRIKVQQVSLLYSVIRNRTMAASCQRDVEYHEMWFQSPDGSYRTESFFPVTKWGWKKWEKFDGIEQSGLMHENAWMQLGCTGSQDSFPAVIREKVVDVAVADADTADEVRKQKALAIDLTEEHHHSFQHYHLLQKALQQQWVQWTVPKDRVEVSFYLTEAGQQWLSLFPTLSTSSTASLETLSQLDPGTRRMEWDNNDHGHGQQWVCLKTGRYGPFLAAESSSGENVSLRGFPHGDPFTCEESHLKAWWEKKRKASKKQPSQPQQKKR